jgi:hypothetical protein
MVIKIAKTKLEEKYDSRQARLNALCIIITSTRIVRGPQTH